MVVFSNSSAARAVVRLFMLRAMVRAGGCVLIDNPDAHAQLDLPALEGPFPPNSAITVARQRAPGVSLAGYTSATASLAAQTAAAFGGTQPAAQPQPSTPDIAALRERAAQTKKRLQALLEAIDRNPAQSVWAAARRQKLKEMAQRELAAEEEMVQRAEVEAAERQQQEQQQSTAAAGTAEGTAPGGGAAETAVSESDAARASGAGVATATAAASVQTQSSAAAQILPFEYVDFFLA